jgi:hypothetical protein
MNNSSHGAGEGALIELARTIGSTLGTVAATVKKARRLSTSTGARKVRRKAATARAKVRRTVKRKAVDARRTAHHAARNISAANRRMRGRVQRAPTRTSSVARKARNLAKRRAAKR